MDVLFYQAFFKVLSSYPQMIDSVSANIKVDSDKLDAHGWPGWNHLKLI